MLRRMAAVQFLYPLLNRFFIFYNDLEFVSLLKVFVQRHLRPFGTEGHPVECTSERITATGFQMDGKFSL